MYFQMKLPLTTNLVDRSDDSHHTLSSEVPDLPNRIVTATAAPVRIPLISRDGKVRASQIQRSGRAKIIETLTYDSESGSAPGSL